VPGRWVEPRPQEVFVPAHWTLEGGFWVFHPGGWRHVAALAPVAVVNVPVAPPPPRVEVMPPAPGPAYFWVAGHWRWEHGAHVWVGGRWEGTRPGYLWAPAHWVAAGPNWHYVPGQWRAN
jgi:hypothetical protein